MIHPAYYAFAMLIGLVITYGVSLAFDAIRDGLLRLTKPKRNVYVNRAPPNR